MVGGDCCVVLYKGKPEEVQVGFAIGGSIFVRLHDCEADQLISMSEDEPFLELTYEQPGGMARARRTVLDNREYSGDPLLREERR